MNIISPKSLTLPPRYLAISGIVIDDPVAATNPGLMWISVECLNGTLSMKFSNGAWVPGSFAKKIVMQATYVESQFALSTLTYKYYPGVANDTITLVVWNTVGTNITQTIALVPAAPVIVVQGSIATRVRTLSSMFAVNTHIDFGPSGLTPQYSDFTKLADNINYIWGNSGIAPLLRDWFSHPSDVTWWPQISSATNAKFIASIGETTPDQYQGYVDRSLSVRSLLAYLDGPNEEDSAAANGLTNGVDAVTSLNSAAAYMPTLYHIGQQQGLPVLNMSYGQGWGTAYDPNYQHGYYGINGDLSASCTYGNAHTYPQNGDPPHDNIVMLNTAAKRAAVSRPVAISEFGYTIGNGGSNVAQDVQAKYGLAGLMDAFTLGNSLYGWYALYDDMSGPWGMFNADYSPRPIATMFRNFLTIMADSGATALSFTVGKLPFTISGCASALFQKSDGSYWLVLWKEQKIAAGQNPTVALTLSLGVSAKALKVYDPSAGTSSVQSGAGSSLAMKVPVHPIVVQIAL